VCTVQLKQSQFQARRSSARRATKNAMAESNSDDKKQVASEVSMRDIDGLVEMVQKIAPLCTSTERAALAKHIAAGLREIRGSDKLEKTAAEARLSKEWQLKLEGMNPCEARKMIATKPSTVTINWDKYVTQIVRRSHETIAWKQDAIRLYHEQCKILPLYLYPYIVHCIGDADLVAFCDKLGFLDVEPDFYEQLWKVQKTQLAGLYRD